MRSSSCSEPSLQPTAFDNVDTPPPNGQVEHIIPLVFLLGRFPAIANHGRYFSAAYYVNEQIGSNSNPTPFVMLQAAINGVKGLYGAAPLVAMFEYLNNDSVVTLQDAGVSRVATALLRIEGTIPAAEGLSAHWNEAYPHYFIQVSQFARTYMDNQIEYAVTAFQDSNATYREYVLAELKRL
ncbi:hypothetical protein V498_05840 [Pseudogymnoascus sp. VKM F-4517 (FW-2822)]|nr:hypothetical protein V498_05840 [Pseudogymnoascus sp. VKM F-4517 (FW-2822)]